MTLFEIRNSPLPVAAGLAGAYAGGMSQIGLSRLIELAQGYKPLERIVVGLIAQVEINASDIGIVSIAFPQNGRIDERGIGIMGKILVDYQYIEVGERIREHPSLFPRLRLYACIRTAGGGIKKTKARTFGSTARNFGSVVKLCRSGVGQQAFSLAELCSHFPAIQCIAANTTGVKQVTFVKKLCAFCEKGSIFIKAHLERRQV